MSETPMSQFDLEVLRLQMRVLAQETILDWIAPILASILSARPTDEQFRAQEAMKRKLSEARSDYLAIAFERLTPSESDLHAAELQEAMDEEIKKIEKMFGLS